MGKRESRPLLRVIAGGGGKAGELVPRAIPGLAHHEAVAEDDDLFVPLADQGAPGRTASGAPDDEEFCPRYREGEHERRRVAADVDRLRYAIVDLAAIELPPARLLKEINPTFDRPIIRDRLLRAIDCLSLFAEEWRLEELTEAARSVRCPHERGER